MNEPDDRSQTLPARARSAPTRAATTRSCSRPPARPSPRTATAATLDDIARRAAGRASARSTATSRPASTCSRRSTSTRSRRSRARPPTSPTCRRGRRSSQWLREFVGYAATKRALAQEMLAYDRPRRRRLPAPRAQRDLRRRRARCSSAPRTPASCAPTPTSCDIARLLGGIAAHPGRRARAGRAHPRHRARRPALPAPALTRRRRPHVRTPTPPDLSRDQDGALSGGSTRDEVALAMAAALWCCGCARRGRGAFRVRVPKWH